MFYVRGGNRVLARFNNYSRVMSSSSSSSFFSAGQRFPPHRRTSGGVFLEWAVESTTVTHSSADWWGLLLPLA